ncbi:type II toxin-antitoxin system RelE/ParE family toxin [Capnocytophaga sputigena]|uniref:type II toxin-antitoxin system RelE/ParE family toxin n=1 Tax=Capnocytophaga sputigena TaxID=1019 RepID=UPI0028EBD0C8|nr:type II toxin-antitoxin system RelE/ParE family toxin [Capnocytophaga sputigena]
MEVTWTAEAENSLSEILEFWDIHNDSPTYSDKILSEVKKVLHDIANNPYFLGRYNQKLDLYTRTILKGRFIIYFFPKDENIIEIHHFRSSKQRPLEEI